MSARLKSVALFCAGMLVAGVATWIWQRHLSRDAQIAALHRACLDEFAAGRAKLKAGVQPDSGPAFMKGLSESLGKMLDGASGRAAEVVCDGVRDACRVDYDGRICTAARERYR